MTNPVRINAGYTRIAGNAKIDFICQEVAFDTYANLGYKGQPGPWPEMMYFNMGQPLSSITFFPTPSNSYEFHLWTDSIFGALSSPTQNIVMPPGYALALELNLALLLALEYGVEPSKNLLTQASKSKKLVKSLNASPVPAQRFESILSGGNISDAGFIYSGGYNY
jgi:hypothetical protein